MNNFYLYTETAFHHQGDMRFIKSLIDATVESGAKGVKFQVLTNPEDTISTRHSQYGKLSSYCFNADQWAEIFSYTRRHGLDIVLMPLNLKALELTEHFSVKYIDIHSVSYNDVNLLEAIKTTDVDVILGVGGRTIDDIAKAYSFFGHQLKVLMVGFQSFPTKLEDAKLGSIALLKKLFPHQTIGYADHSSYLSEYSVLSNEYARLLGAEIFEKHITTSEGEERVDYQSAVPKEKITEINKRLSFLEENILLSPADLILLNDSEISYRNRQLRCVASRSISVGEEIEEGDISLKQVDIQENTYSNIKDLLGGIAARDLLYDEPIYKGDIKRD